MKKTLTLVFLAMSAAALAQNPNPIRVNQVGYAPADSKTASVEEAGWAKQYTIKDATTGKTVWKGKAVRTTKSPWSGKERAIIDFSVLNKSGKYIISNGKDSQEIIVTERPYEALSTGALKAFYLQRSGEPILEQYAGEYARPTAHLDDHVEIHPSAATQSRPAGSYIESKGGWYDAGDYNKYIVNSAFSVGIMLDAYEMAPEYFEKLNVNIPESTNDVPDILDELAVNLRWMQTMQDPEDGGVYHKLTTPGFEAFIKPSDCKQQRYVVMKSTAATLDFAAVMAHAYRIYSKFPSFKEWANTALLQAVKAYEWAQKHPDVLYKQEEMNAQFDPDVFTGTYGDMNVKDEQMWAEIELFLATGKESYMRNIANSYSSLHFSNPSWGNVTGLGYFSIIGALKEGIMPYAYEVKSFLKNQILEVADGYLSTMGTSCFDSPCGNTSRDFGWGCNGEQVCGKGMILLYAYELSGDKKYLDAAKKAADYLLGRNATGYCFVTGFGTFSPKHPHHRLSESDGIDEPLPGFLVGGPNPGQQDKGSGAVYSSDFPDESYSDVMASYASNEIAINWNATLVAFIGWLDSFYCTK